jgi:hypothetical protein
LAQTADKPSCSFLNKQLSVASAHLLFWPVFLLGLAADLWSKSAIFNWLSPQAPQRYSIIDGLFQLVIVENRGAAWGIAADKTMSLVVISVLAIIVVFGMFLFGRKLQMVVVLALGLFEQKHPKQRKKAAHRLEVFLRKKKGENKKKPTAACPEGKDLPCSGCPFSQA